MTLLQASLVTVSKSILETTRVVVADELSMCTHSIGGGVF